MRTRNTMSSIRRQTQQSGGKECARKITARHANAVIELHNQMAQYLYAEVAGGFFI